MSRNTLKQYINEVLNKPFKYKWTKKSVGKPSPAARSVAEFDTGDGRIFSVDIIDVIIMILKKKNYRKISIAFEDRKGKTGEERMGVSGKGKAFRVFATVGAILLEYLQKNKEVVAIDFIGEEQDLSRIKLYKKFANMIPGFKLQVAEYGYFLLVKKDAPQDVKDYFDDMD